MCAFISDGNTVKSVYKQPKKSDVAQIQSVAVEVWMSKLSRWGARCT